MTSTATSGTRACDEAVIQARNDQAVAVAALPDGSAWHPRKQWDRFLSEVQDFTAATYREQPEEAKRRLDVMKETWRQCHDRDVDHTYALMSLIKEQLGEAAIRDMYDRVLLPLFVWRYEKFDVDKYPWDESLEILMLVACEAMRGHLVGPERTGDMELVETRGPLRPPLRPMRLGWTDHPRRLDRGHAAADAAAVRLEGHRGAAHLEPQHAGRLPLLHPLHHPHGGDADGPLRLSRPRRGPARVRRRAHRGRRAPQKCQWQMFKDPTQVPEEYYTRVGRTKPTAFGSKAQRRPRAARHERGPARRGLSQRRVFTNPGVASLLRRRPGPHLGDAMTVKPADLHAQPYFDDPFPVWERLRHEQPLFHDTVDDRWLLTRYDDVAAVFRDHETYSTKPVQAHLQRRHRARRWSQMDGDRPRHPAGDRRARARRPEARDELPAALIDTVVDELLDRLPTSGPVDLIGRSAMPLPLKVIATILGMQAGRRCVPRSDDRRSHRGPGRRGAGAVARASRPTRAFTAHIDALIEERMAAPGPDLISGIAQGRTESGERLSRQEIASFIAC